jgi:hypothetical protein
MKLLLFTYLRNTLESETDLSTVYLQIKYQGKIPIEKQTLGVRVEK